MTNPVAVTSYNLTYFKNLPLVPESNIQAVHLARSNIRSALLQCGASESVLRLLQSDLLESLLIRALDVFLVAPKYLSLTEQASKVRFLNIHLYAITLFWLSQRMTSDFDAETLTKAKHFLEKF